LFFLKKKLKKCKKSVKKVLIFEKIIFGGKKKQTKKNLFGTKKNLI
jgi:hypothetical protein